MIGCGSFFHANEFVRRFPPLSKCHAGFSFNALPRCDESENSGHVSPGCLRPGRGWVHKAGRRRKKLKWGMSFGDDEVLKPLVEIGPEHLPFSMSRVRFAVPHKSYSILIQPLTKPRRFVCLKTRQDMLGVAL